MINRHFVIAALALGREPDQAHVPLAARSLALEVKPLEKPGVAGLIEVLAKQGETGRRHARYDVPFGACPPVSQRIAPASATK